MCNPHVSGIPNEPRLPYYSEVEKFSNFYMLEIGLGGSYGHQFKNVTIEDLVRWDGVVYCDGVKGGTSGALH